MADADFASGMGGVENGAATELHVENGKQPATAAVAAGGVVTYKPVKPHLIFQAPRCVEAIAFYKAAFGAEEVMKTFAPKRKAEQEQPNVMHAHLRVGEAEIYVADEPDECEKTHKSNVQNPAALNGSSMFLHLDTNDVDAAVAKALAAGATVGLEVADQFWGERYGSVVDPFGYAWSFSTPLPKGADPPEMPAEATSL